MKLPFGGQLDRKIVQNIHLDGGSMLGVSRGGARTTDIVDSIEVSFLQDIRTTAPLVLKQKLTRI